MENQWNIQVWGTRGSMPVTGKEFLEYGGNTSCISVDWGGGLAVLDGGSGLLKLGAALKKAGKNKNAAGPGTFRKDSQEYTYANVQDNGQQGRSREHRPVHMLFSHLHIDHIIGLFGFSLLHDPQAEIHFYGEGRSGASFRKLLGQVAGQPYWPLGLEDYQARLHFHEITPGQQFLLRGTGRDISVDTLRGTHPGGSILYRLESGAGDRRSEPESGAGIMSLGQEPVSGARSLVYGLDCELDGRMFGELAEFAAGVDVLVCDAHFAAGDLESHQGWGHSSWEQGAALRRASGAALAVMTHFSPEYTDAFLRQQEAAVRALDDQCCFAKEGMEMRI